MIKLDGQPIGVLDLHVNHPDRGVCYVGLLLIGEKYISIGLGLKCYELAADYIRRSLQCSKILIENRSLKDLSIKTRVDVPEEYPSRSGAELVLLSNP